MSEVVETPQSQDRTPRGAILLAVSPAVVPYRASGLVLCRKTDFVILPRHRLTPASKDAYACLPPPNRNRIAVNIMPSSNLDNTGSRRQTPLHDPKLLGSGPPPPLGTGQNRNRRHVCSFARESNEQIISPSSTIREGGLHRGLTL